jgi:outer membrane protein OmpA-like peptidoglycan-associated protein
MSRFTALLIKSGPRAAGVLALVFLAGCASQAPLVDVESANAAYEQAAQDTDVARYAAVQLYEAKQVLDKANGLVKTDPANASHQARIALTGINVARSVAVTGRTRTETKALFEQRDKLLLESRTLAAEKALAEAGRANTRAQTAEQRAKAAEDAAKAAQIALSDLQGKQTDRGYVLTLGGDIMFDTGKAVVNPGAMQQLFRIVTFMRENPDRQLLVEGHTDAVGSEGSNLSLSQRRADSVAAFLSQNGISGSRLATRGYGESRPIVGNDTPAGRQQNRRVEIVILNPGQTASEAAAQ